jgi:hypothetical protein
MWPERASPWRFLLFTLAIASVLTLLNALKPLHMDDATFYQNARQIAEHPGDPYGFALMRWDEPVPANHALAPPALPAWWAAAIRLFGERPFLWKCWLLPWCWLFAISLGALLRRFAFNVWKPLLFMVAFSPVVVPGINLAMDLPALALSLLSLALFVWAIDHDSAALAGLAGLTLGVGVQTKYTAFLAVVVLLAYAWLFRKTALWFKTSVVTALVFTTWEGWIATRYGESHFLYQLGQGDNSDEPKLKLLLALCPLLGAAFPTLAPLALLALRAPRWLVLASAILAAAPFVALVCPVSPVAAAGATLASKLLLSSAGAAVLLAVAGAVWRIRYDLPAESPSVADSGLTARFLVLWLAIEVAGYFAISPFPAVRRIMGIVVAATVVVGFLAGRLPPDRWRQNLTNALAAATALLGLGFFGVDCCEARAQQVAAEAAAGHIRQEDAQGTIWFTGYWGFQFYAGKVGMKHAVPLFRPTDQRLRYPEPAHFHKGDWLVVPSRNIAQQNLFLDRRNLEFKERIAIDDPVPLSTVDCYYAGTFPLRRRPGPRLVLLLFRVRADMTPPPSRS